MKKSNENEKIFKNNRTLDNLTQPGAILESLAYLPKPHIYNMYCQSEVMEQYLGKAKDKFVSFLKEKNIFITEILTTLYHQNDTDINNALITLARKSQPNISNVKDVSFQAKEAIEKALFQYRFSVCDGAIFEITDTLSKALIETDITGKCPTQYIRPPFDHIYVHFGVNQDYSLNVDKDDSYLEGAYISYIKITDQHCSINEISSYLHKVGKNISNVEYAIEITFSFSKKVKNNAKDTKESRIYFIIDNEKDDIETTIEKHKELWGATDGDFYRLYNSTLHIAKTLLLINTKKKSDITLKVENSRKLVKKKALKKYTSKKAMRKSLESYDKIVIDTESTEFIKDYNLSRQSTSSGKKIHWRRGHFRELPVLLPNRPEPRLIWIKPSLIGTKSRTITNIEKKGYVAL